MTDKNAIYKIQSELQQGMTLAKCKQCGCMKETLESLRSTPSLQTKGSDLLKNVESWQKQMKPIKYACLGCEHCFAAVATNFLNQVFPEAALTQSLSCGFEVREQTWPPVPGEYTFGSSAETFGRDGKSLFSGHAKSGRKPKKPSKALQRSFSLCWLRNVTFGIQC